MSRLAPLLLAPLLLVTACGPWGEEPFIDVVPIEENGPSPDPNRGAVCALSSPSRDWTQRQAFASGAPLHFRFSVGECLSSTCTRDRFASCAVTVEGGVIRIETHAEWTTPQGMNACTADCADLSAECASPPLEEGTYTVHAEGHAFSVTVPSEVATAPCNVEPW